MTNREEVIKCFKHIKEKGLCHGSFDCFGTNNPEEILDFAIKILEERPTGKKRR